MPNSLIINPGSVSFSEIRQRMIEYGFDGPWRDWLESSDTMVIVEWLAGMGAFLQYSNFARRRETSLEHAQLESSIYELAVQRGYLVPPVTAAEMSMTILSNDELNIGIGDLVGLLGNYNLYSLKSYEISANVETEITCVIGDLETFFRQVNVGRDFVTYSFETEHRYIGIQLEEFRAGTLVGSLTDDDVYVEGVLVDLESIPRSDFDQDTGRYSSNYLLRRTMSGVVRIYSGNGALGWKSENASAISYRVLTYGANVASSLNDTPSLSLAGDVIINNFEISKLPNFDPDKENVRATARYYPKDGNIIHDRHYESSIRGSSPVVGRVDDVYAVNIDPIEDVYILTRETLTTQDKVDLENFVDQRRGLGIPVQYTYLSRSDGVIFNARYRILRNQLNDDLRNRVQFYLDNKRFKFCRENKTLSSIELGLELSANFGIQFIPVDESYAVSLGPRDFFRLFLLVLLER